MKFFILVTTILFSHLVLAFEVMPADVARANIGQKQDRFSVSGKNCVLVVTSEDIGDDDNTVHYHFGFNRPNGLSEVILSSNINSPNSEYWFFDKANNSLDFIMPDEGKKYQFEYEANTLNIEKLQLVNHNETCQF